MRAGYSELRDEQRRELEHRTGHQFVWRQVCRFCGKEWKSRGKHTACERRAEGLETEREIRYSFEQSGGVATLAASAAHA